MQWLTWGPFVGSDHYPAPPPLLCLESGTEGSDPRRLKRSSEVGGGGSVVPVFECLGPVNEVTIRQLLGPCLRDAPFLSLTLFWVQDRTGRVETLGSAGPVDSVGAVAGPGGRTLFLRLPSRPLVTTDTSLYEGTFTHL